MPAAIPFIPAIVTAVAAVGTAAVQANATKKAGEKQNQIAEDQARTSQAQQQQVIDRQNNQESTAAANTARDAAKKRQGELAAGATGQRSTILTSPVGLATPTTVATKTLLGQ